MPEEFSLFEKTWLRTSFELRCLSGGFARNTRRFDTAVTQLLRTVEPLDYDLLSRAPGIPRLMGMRPASCQWSVLMVIDHLRRHTDFMLEAIRSLTIDNELVLTVPDFRYLVPDDAGADCIDQFQDSVWQYVSFVNNMYESGKHREHTGSIVHPFLGRMSIQRLNAFASFHLSIHRSQIQKILATEGMV